MQKVFFLLPSMRVGGIEKSFLGLLTTLKPEQFEIHLGLIHLNGELLGRLPPYIHIHEISVYNKFWPIINDPPKETATLLIRDGHLGLALMVLFLHLWMRLTGSSYWTYRYLLRKEPNLEGLFDIAVAYAGPSQMIDYYICEKVNAKIKYGWLHFDISQFGIDRGLTRRLYRQYRKIYVVSEEARKVFVKAFPQFANKTEVFYNIVNKAQILEKAANGPSFDDLFSGIRILTVGRISQEKGQRDALDAIKLLVKERTDFRWYFVGEGKDLTFCKHFAANEGLSDHVLFLGLQMNPYAYYRDCDLYVQPSRHEGFCITLAEALCFDKPIVATRFAGAQEQLTGRKMVWICDPNPKALAQTVVEALKKIKP